MLRLPARLGHKGPERGRVQEGQARKEVKAAEQGKNRAWSDQKDPKS